MAWLSLQWLFPEYQSSLNREILCFTRTAWAFNLLFQFGSLGSPSHLTDGVRNMDPPPLDLHMQPIGFSGLCGNLSDGIGTLRCYYTVGRTLHIVVSFFLGGFIAKGVREFQRRCEIPKREKSRAHQRSMEETTMKRLKDLETALWEAIGKLDRTKLAIKKLENENAEIRADIEAYKLIVSENKRIKLEVLKREKKCLRKLGVWEKQKKKLQDAIAAEMQNISDLQQQLVELEAAKKEAEAKWKQERRAREQAFALVKAELRRNEEAKATNKRTLEGMRLRFKIDSQRHKDDLQRLHQELSQLKASVSNELPEGDAARVLRDFERLEVSSAKNANSNRMCVICRKGEVSVVLLPCAHQALCTNCNDYYGKNGRAKCPCCGVPIEQRIQVFV